MCACLLPQGDTAQGWAPVGPQLELPHIKWIYPTGGPAGSLGTAAAVTPAATTATAAAAAWLPAWLVSNRQGPEDIWQPLSTRLPCLWNAAAPTRPITVNMGMRMPGW